MVGSNSAERETESDEGQVDFYSDIATTTPWLTLYGNAHDHFGYAVANAGDINNDGEADYVIGIDIQ
jgi:hypothetical protein